MPGAPFLRGDRLTLRTVTPDDHEFLFEIEPQRDHAELGCWIAPDEQGKGYATEASRLCLDHAFADRGLHKVLARVFEHNDASMAVRDKLGFQQEGRLREQDYIRGAYRDTLLFGLLAAAFER